VPFKTRQRQRPREAQEAQVDHRNRPEQQRNPDQVHRLHGGVDPQRIAQCRRYRRTFDRRSPLRESARDFD